MRKEGLTPAGIQFAGELARRRFLVLVLNVATWALLMLALAHVCSLPAAGR